MPSVSQMRTFALPFGLFQDALDERDDEAVDVGLGGVFEVDPRRDAGLHRRHDRLEVLVGGLFLAPVAELVEDVVVGGRGEHPRLLDSAAGDLGEELDILRRGPRPRGDLGEVVTPFEELF